MSALADFAHKFGTESRELRIGQSFFNDSDSCFHTIRYDFVPASVDPNKTSIVDFGSNGKVTVTMPNLEGSGTGRESVYQGMRKPHQKECVLIFNPDTGELVLEKLNTSMIVKKARLRQDDSTGKPLNTLNNNQKPTLSNGSSSSGPSSSQAKSSINNEKAKSSTLKSATVGQNMPTVGSASSAAKLSNKTSPPLLSTSTGLTAPRTNGFRQKTPSPPSMPIFSANKGSLLHTNGTPTTSGRSSDSSQDWNGGSGAKSKEPSQQAPITKISHKNEAKHSSSNRNLSEDSSSDSDANSDDESDSSSQSSDSSSDDEEMRPVPMSSELSSSSSKQVVNGVAVNALSMPSILSSISMPNALALPSGLDSTSPSMLLHSSSSNHAKSPIPESSKKASQASALSLSLSEDSDDSSDGEAEVKRPGHLNGNDMQQKKDLPKSGSPLESTSKCSPFDSMPKFLNNGSTPSAPSTFPPIPKVTYSQLSQDLQLSESGSDSDD